MMAESRNLSARTASQPARCSAREAAAGKCVEVVLVGKMPLAALGLLPDRDQARLADIAVGLLSPADAGYWRALGQCRLQLLDCDADHYGLAAHEEAERAQLRQLLA